MRETGYYWVKFDWARFGQPEKIHWEIASWDAEAHSWAMIGSREMIPVAFEGVVFREIDEIVIPPRN